MADAPLDERKEVPVGEGRAGSASALSLASPFWKTGPTIRSMDLKRPMIRVMGVTGPGMDHVAAVPSPEASSANVVVASDRTA